MSSHVFLSYVRENGHQAERLASDLRKLGVDVWIDRRNLMPGVRWRDAIRNAIRNGHLFVACFSREYSNRESSHMNEELTLAIEELRRRASDRAWFIPVLLDDAEMPDRAVGAGESLRDLQWVNLAENWNAGVGQIAAAARRYRPEHPRLLNTSKQPIPKTKLSAGGNSGRGLLILRLKNLVRGARFPREVSSASDAIKKWVTGWTITVILVPMLLTIAGVGITNYWNRSQLTVSITKAVVGSHRVVDSAGVHEYRAILDLRTPCVAWLAENSAASEDVMPPAETPVMPRLVYGVYLENRGRSELKDIRIVFRSPRGRFTINGSPQLSLTTTQDIDPGGNTIQTVAVASLAPRARGVILGSLAVDGGSVRVEKNTKSRYTVWYDLLGMEGTPKSVTHVFFAGTRELNHVEHDMISVNDFFGQQKTLFGLESVNLPIDPIEISAKGGEASYRIIIAPYQACPTTAPEGSYTISIHQRGKEEISTAASGAS